MPDDLLCVQQDSELSIDLANIFVVSLSFASGAQGGIQAQVCAPSPRRSIRMNHAFAERGRQKESLLSKKPRSSERASRGSS
jgi:hypothetical protein